MGVGASGLTPAPSVNNLTLRPPPGLEGTP